MRFTFITVFYGVMVPLTLISTVPTTLARLPHANWTQNMTRNDIFYACRNGMEAEMLAKRPECNNTLEVTGFLSGCETQALWDTVSLLNGCGVKDMLLRHFSGNQTCFGDCIDTLYDESKLCVDGDRPPKSCFLVTLRKGADCGYDCGTHVEEAHISSCLQACSIKYDLALKLCHTVGISLIDVCKSLTQEFQKDCVGTCQFQHIIRNRGPIIG